MKDSKRNRLVNWLLNLDRRVVYLFILIAVSMPFFFKPVLSLQTTRWVKSSYELIEEAARRNKPIMIGMDYDPATLAELQPMAEAFLRHAFSKGVKVLGVNYNIQGTSLGASTLDRIAKEYGKTYGEDYVYFGWVPQFMVVLISMGDDFRESYEKDYRGTDVDKIPMLKNLQNFDDFHLVISISGTSIPVYYIRYGVTKFKFNFVAGVTAVSAPEYYPYLHSGQMKGLLGSMKAAAEYEGLLDKPADAMRGMASQSWGHLTMIFFIIVGNILYYLKKRVDSRKSQGV